MHRYFCIVKYFTRFIDVLLYTSVFAALCALSLCMATERLVNGVRPLVLNDLHILVFGSTLFVYNTPRVVKIIGKAHLERYRLRNWYLLFFGVGSLITAYALLQLPASMVALSCLPGILSFSYFLPVLPFRNKKRLRDIGWLKILVLTGVWTIATSVLPIVYWQKAPAMYPFEILLRFVLVFILCLLFDLRDMRPDLKNNIYTLPNTIGVENTYRLVFITLGLFAVLSLVQYNRHPQAERMAAAAVTTVATWFVVQYVKKQPRDRVYLLQVDGIMLLYAVVILL